MYCFALSDFCDNPQRNILIGANIRIFVTNKLTPLNSFLLEKLAVAQIVPFMEHEHSCSGHMSAQLEPVLIQLNPTHILTLSPEGPIMFSSSLHVWTPSGFFPSDFLRNFSFFPLRYLWLARLLSPFYMNNIIVPCAFISIFRYTCAHFRSRIHIFISDPT